MSRVQQLRDGTTTLLHLDWQCGNGLNEDDVKYLPTSFRVFVIVQKLLQQWNKSHSFQQLTMILYRCCPILTRDCNNQSNIMEIEALTIVQALENPCCWS